MTSGQQERRRSTAATSPWAARLSCWLAARQDGVAAGPPTRRFRVLSAEHPRHWTDEVGGEEGEAGWRWRRQRRRRREVCFPENAVSTAKYTWLTFIPRCVRACWGRGGVDGWRNGTTELCSTSHAYDSALFEQFRRLANVYFAVVSVLMMIGTYSDLFQSPLTPYTTLIPLCVVLAITMGKEGFEDVKRHTADLKTNHRPSRALSLTTPGAFDHVQWRHIRVGR